MSEYLLKRPERDPSALTQFGEALLCIAVAAFARSIETEPWSRAMRAFRIEVDLRLWGPGVEWMVWEFACDLARWEVSQ